VLVLAAGTVTGACETFCSRVTMTLSLTGGTGAGPLVGLPFGEAPFLKGVEVFMGDSVTAVGLGVFAAPEQPESGLNVILREATEGKESLHSGRAIGMSFSSAEPVSCTVCGGGGARN